MIEIHTYVVVCCEHSREIWAFQAWDNFRNLGNRIFWSQVCVSRSTSLNSTIQGPVRFNTDFLAAACFGFSKWAHSVAKGTTSRKAACAMCHQLPLCSLVHLCSPIPCGVTTMANTKKLTIFNSNQIALPFQ